MDLKDKFRGRSVESLINQLVDAKKHSFCNLYTIESIDYVIAELLHLNKDVIKLIQSDDHEIFFLGVQMLFKDYLNEYNELCENPKWEQIIFNTVRYYGNQTI